MGEGHDVGVPLSSQLDVAVFAALRVSGDGDAGAAEVICCGAVAGSPAVGDGGVLVADGGGAAGEVDAGEFGQDVHAGFAELGDGGGAFEPAVFCVVEGGFDEGEEFHEDEGAAGHGVEGFFEAEVD
ncbi:MAG: hypothetical protein JWN40_4995 [Phycisphaerales bacterium]|nr:hypothetical protein [Phycisphaerales bacterium]